MSRMVKSTLIIAAVLATATLEAQVIFRNPTIAGTAGVDPTGGFAQSVSITTTTRVTRFGFFIGVNTGFTTGPSSFTAYIASNAAPTVRLWEGSFVRNMNASADYGTDAFSLDLAPGTYFFAMYGTSGVSAMAWRTVAAGPYVQNGITQVGHARVNATGALVPPPEPDLVPPGFGRSAAMALFIEGTQDLAPTPPPVGVIPEPSTYALMTTGLVALAALRRRRASAMT